MINAQLRISTGPPSGVRGHLYHLDTWAASTADRAKGVSPRSKEAASSVHVSVPPAPRPRDHCRPTPDVTLPNRRVLACTEVLLMDVHTTYLCGLHTCQLWGVLNAQLCVLNTQLRDSHRWRCSREHRLSRSSEGSRRLQPHEAARDRYDSASWFGSHGYDLWLVHSFQVQPSNAAPQRLAY